MQKSIQTTRRALTQAMLAAPILGVAGAGVAAPAASSAVPGKTWTRFPAPEAAGFSAERLKAFEATLYAQATTSLMVVKDGRIVYSYGDIAEPSYLASSRKSVLSMLYGKYVANGKIDLDRTLADLGVDDEGGLLPIEKTARIRDILTARSGVYHSSSTPYADPKLERGSKKPGSYFAYNNWDFNIAGVIFQKLSGKTVFAALQEDLATPLGFEDFYPARQRMLGYVNSKSRYPAYHLFLSCRDMARLGVVMLDNGRWGSRQVIPASWVKESTALHVPLKTMSNAAAGEMGYAYYWWIPSESRPGADWQGSYTAAGNYGQYILVLPRPGLVIVHRRAVPDEFAIARNSGLTDASPIGVSNGDFLKMADAILAARV